MFNFIFDSKYLFKSVYTTNSKNRNIFFSSSILFSLVGNHLVYYPTPRNINYVWSFGSLAGLFFGIQILTGVFLAMHYVPNIELAFLSVEHIMRDIKFGWCLRYLHSNGASMVFIMIYLHLSKGLYFRSYTYPRIYLWFTGVLIFLLMMATAFIGYVLPWGQMSFWGATVITNLITAVPYVGEPIAYWLWGGFSVGNPTLNRFFSIHYLLPFLVTGLIFLHLSWLHYDGSTNPNGILSVKNVTPFWPYFGVKDSFIFFFTLTCYSFILFFYPNLLGHTDNYIPANPLVTPTHIVPEWYFLPFYAILRAIPDKLGGVIAMLFSILVFFLIPFIGSFFRIKSTRFLFLNKFLFYSFISTFLFLMWIGGNPAEAPFVFAGKVASVCYFLILFLDCLFNLNFIIVF